jgi:hypothetical protein
MRGLLFILLLAQTYSFLFAETRTWTDADGVRFEGEYYKELLGGVLIKDLEGKRHLIRLEQLSKDDLVYIERHIPPEVEAEVEIEARMLPKTEWSRQDDNTTVYTFNVAVKKKSRLSYEGPLCAELFVVAKERAVDDDRRVLMSYTKNFFVFPGEEDAIYTFSVPDISFNAYSAGWIRIGSAKARGKDYLGWILVVRDSPEHFIFSGTDMPGSEWLAEDLPRAAEKLRELYVRYLGSVESRHFNDSFIKVAPPRIPWFARSKTD